MNIVSYENTITAMENIKSKKIDIKATIENTKKADFLGLEEAYCQAIDSDECMSTDFSEMSDKEDFTIEDYYNSVFEYLEKGNGIYIALCYLADAGPDTENLKFNNNSSLEDEYFILIDKSFEELMAMHYNLGMDFLDEDNDRMSYFCIDNAFNTVAVECPEKYELSCDISSDYGIAIKKENDEFKVRFGHRQFTSAGPCMGPPCFFEFKETEDPSDEESLYNPLNELMILLMENVIVFEE